jgi:hypothetical protein
MSYLPIFAKSKTSSVEIDTVRHNRREKRVPAIIFLFYQHTLLQRSSRERAIQIRLDYVWFVSLFSQCREELPLLFQRFSESH